MLAGLLLALLCWGQAGARPLVLRNVAYVHGGGPEQTLDLYLPVSGRAPFPLVVVVHGGGWQEGDKSHPGPFEDLVSAGFAVACTNYRLAPAHPFPASIEDVKAAVRFMRAHAHEFHVDPLRIGAWGQSAGGHLVALLALAGPTSGWDVGDNLQQSSAVEAVVDLFGPSDFLARERVSILALHDVAQAFGTDPRKLERASPVTWVRHGAPPFLLVHGDRDQMVPLAQTTELYQRLRQAGDSAELIVAYGAGHMFSGAPAHAIDAWRHAQIRFLRRALGVHSSG